MQNENHLKLAKIRFRINDKSGIKIYRNNGDEKEQLSYPNKNRKHREINITTEADRS